MECGIAKKDDDFNITKRARILNMAKLLNPSYKLENGSNKHPIVATIPGLGGNPYLRTCIQVSEDDCGILPPWICPC